CGLSLKGHDMDVHAIAFAPAGGEQQQQVATCSDDMTVKLWDLGAGGTCTRTLKGHIHWVTCLAYSSDGKQLASGGRDNAVWLWDTASGQGTALAGGLGATVVSLAWHPPASSWPAPAQTAPSVPRRSPPGGGAGEAYGGRAAVRRRAAGRPAAGGAGGAPGRRVVWLAFDATGRRLATCSSDKPVRVREWVAGG
ncbi:hypothetical protein HXX76_016260, partial [Chlamydomonas incerta]